MENMVTWFNQWPLHFPTKWKVGWLAGKTSGRLWLIYLYDHIYYLHLLRGCINEQTELFADISSEQLSQDIDFALVLHPQLDAGLDHTELVPFGHEKWRPLWTGAETWWPTEVVDSCVLVWNQNGTINFCRLGQTGQKYTSWLGSIYILYIYILYIRWGTCDLEPPNHTLKVKVESPQLDVARMLQQKGSAGCRSPKWGCYSGTTNE